jgi:riboflavin biosynthesis pyrimidine reductase
MICSADGATTRDGKSGGLGDDADREVFAGLRRMADVILVGAATVRTERYGPPKKGGQTVAVVSRSGHLDFGSMLFSSGAGLAIIPEDGPDLPVPTLRAGIGGVDLTKALGLLGERGAKVVLTEGGPTIIGQLASLGCIDELCLTISPLLLSGESARVAHGAPADLSLELVHVLEDGGSLLLRYFTAS